MYLRAPRPLCERHFYHRITDANCLIFLDNHPLPRRRSSPPGQQSRRFFEQHRRPPSRPQARYQCMHSHLGHIHAALISCIQPEFDHRTFHHTCSRKVCLFHKSWLMSQTHSSSSTLSRSSSIFIPGVPGLSSLSTSP